MGTTELGPNGENWPTHSVALWICNDVTYYVSAKQFAEEGDHQGLGVHLQWALKTAKQGTAAWHTAQDLSPNDYDRIDWHAIAADLTEE